MIAGNCTNCGKPTSAEHYYSYGFKQGRSYLVLLCKNCNSKLSVADKEALAIRESHKSSEDE